MKKTATLCMAAMLTIGASATAYAAPRSLQDLLLGGRYNSISCEGDLKETLKDRLEACFPNLSFPSIPSLPHPRV